MKTYLLDVNVWIAAALESHLHHPAAMRWLAEHPMDRFAFCRTTQQGFLRIATNPRAVQEKPLTLPQAWEAYDTMLNHPRIIFLDEPPELEGIGGSTPKTNRFLPRSGRTPTWPHLRGRRTCTCSRSTAASVDTTDCFTRIWPEIDFGGVASNHLCEQFICHQFSVEALADDLDLRKVVAAHGEDAAVKGSGTQIDRS